MAGSDKLDPSLLPPRYSLARHYTRTQQIPEAIAVCEDLLARAQDDAWLHRTLASLYGSAGRYSDAQREVEKMLVREPQAADLHALKAMTLAQRGLLPEALESQKKAVALNPGNAWSRIALAGQLAGMRHWDEAASEFERAIALDPKNLNFRLQATQFYAMRQQPHLARPHLEAAIGIEPDSAEAHGWLGQIHLFAGQFTEAQREMEIALRLTPKDGRLLANFALLYAKQNRLDLAEQSWRQSIDANPSMPEPYIWLCQLYGMQDRRGELQSTLETLKRVAPPAAQQLEMHLQMTWNQSGGNPAAVQYALQQQWTAMVQNQPAAPPQPNWTSGQGRPPHPPSLGEFARAALAKLTGSS